jgi:hypothetical protein
MASHKRVLHRQTREVADARHSGQNALVVCCPTLELRRRCWHLR